MRDCFATSASHFLPAMGSIGFVEDMSFKQNNADQAASSLVMALTLSGTAPDMPVF
jgi:hypothetical protein